MGEEARMLRKVLQANDPNDSFCGLRLSTPSLPSAENWVYRCKTCHNPPNGPSPPPSVVIPLIDVAPPQNQELRQRRGGVNNTHHNHPQPPQASEEHGDEGDTHSNSCDSNVFLVFSAVAVFLCIMVLGTTAAVLTPQVHSPDPNFWVDASLITFFLACGVGTGLVARFGALNALRICFVGMLIASLVLLLGVENVCDNVVLNIVAFIVVSVAVQGVFSSLMSVSCSCWDRQCCPAQLAHSGMCPVLLVLQHTARFNAAIRGPLGLLRGSSGLSVRAAWSAGAHESASDCLCTRVCCNGTTLVCSLRIIARAA